VSFPTNPGPIIGAGSRGSIVDTFASQPNLGGALSGWMRPLSIVTVRTRINAGGIAEKDERTVDTFGMKQPMLEKLALQKEGDRSWRWYILHTTSSLRVETNDRIVLNGARYKIMTKKDHSENGYFEYEMIEDYQSA
jgi:hypothetical protein